MAPILTTAQRRTIRKLLRGDLCREYVDGTTGTFTLVFCKTCGRTELVHLLRAAYQALVAAEKAR